MSFLLTGLFFLVGLNNTEAQQSARGTANPYTAIAQSFGVAAYPLGTFEQTAVKTALENILTTIRPLLENGASQTQRLTYEYVSRVLSDVNYNIAVEISLLKRLEEMKRSKNLIIPNNQVGSYQHGSQLVTLYNNTVNELQ